MSSQFQPPKERNPAPAGGFADALSQTLQTSTPGTATTSGVAAVQVGTGAQTTSIQNNFTQGPINSTGVPSDLAVSGEGFFTVKDPTTGASFVTRSGDFRVDTNGYLVTSKGCRVQGYNDAALSATGDIKIDTTDSTGTIDPTLSYAGYAVDTQGEINVRLSDGSSFTRGQVLLQSFKNPQALFKQGDNLYSYLADHGLCHGRLCFATALKRFRGGTSIKSDLSGKSKTKSSSDKKDLSSKKPTAPLNDKVLVNLSGSQGTRYLLAKITLVGVPEKVLDPLNGICVLEVNPRLGLTIVDRLMGGAGNSLDVDRDLSEIEVALLDQAVNIIIGE